MDAGLRVSAARYLGTLQLVSNGSAAHCGRFKQLADGMLQIGLGHEIGRANRTAVDRLDGLASERPPWWPGVWPKTGPDSSISTGGIQRMSTHADAATQRFFFF